jgi:hypothetical protein
MRATDLPVGTKVEWAGRTYLRDRKGMQGWDCGAFGFYIDSEIDGMIRLGASVTLPAAPGDGHA